MRSCVRILGVTCTILACGAVAMGYEADTHYAWTYYLALQLGYSQRQAYQIASAAYAIDEDRDTSPMEATSGDALYGATHAGLWSLGNTHPQIARIWVRFHAFSEANFPDQIAEEARTNMKEELWQKARAEGNPGPYIHYIQDYYSHHEFDNVRGHAALGHRPDYLSADPDHKARAATEETVKALERFMREVLKCEPKRADFGRIWRVVDKRMVPANPAPWVTSPSNFATGSLFDRVGRPSLPRAVRAVDEAIEEDSVSGRFGSWPGSETPTVPVTWIPYDFDASGSCKDPFYRVEKVVLKLGKEQVQFRRTGAIYEVTLHLPYEISGVAHLLGMENVSVIERQELSDYGAAGVSSENRTNGQFTVTKNIQRTRAQLQSGTLKWTCTVHLFGQEPQTRESIIQLTETESASTYPPKIPDDDLSPVLQAGKDLYDQCEYEKAIDTLNRVLQAASITPGMQPDRGNVGGAIIAQAKEYIVKCTAAQEGVRRIEGLINEAAAAREACDFQGGIALLDKVNAVSPPEGRCKSQLEARTASLYRELLDLVVEEQWASAELAMAQSQLKSCDFKSAQESAAVVQSGTSESRCMEKYRKEAAKIEFEAERLARIADDIDTQLTIARLALVKNPPNKKGEIAEAVGKIKALIASSGLPSCFQDSQNDVEVLEAFSGRTPLDTMRLNNYGKTRDPGDPRDPWTASTAEAGDGAASVVDETPRMPSGASEDGAATGDDRHSADKPDWGNTVTNVIKSVADAIIQARTPGGAGVGDSEGGDAGGGGAGVGDVDGGQSGGVVDADTAGGSFPDKSASSQDPFVGSWRGDMSQISSSLVRDAQGNVCGSTSDQWIRFEISKTMEGYSLTEPGEDVARSIRVTNSSVAFSEIAVRYSGFIQSVQVELGRSGLTGTVRIQHTSGCVYVYSLTATRE